MPIASRLSPERVGRSGRAEFILWSISLVFVSSAFATAIAVGSHWQPIEVEAGAPPPAVMIEFAPVVAAPAPAEDFVVEPAAEEALASDDVPAAEPSDVPIADPDPVEQPDPEPIAEPQQGMEPEAEPLTSEPPETAPVEPAVAPEPTLTERVEIPLEISELRQETPRTIHTPPAPAASAPSRQTAPSATRADTAPTMAAPQTVEAPSAPTDSPERWQSQLFAHLNRYKQYPAQARSRREQGVAYVRFTIDGSGRIVSSTIVQSSGSAALDAAVSDLMRSASPVPPPPSELGSPLSLTAPIEFTIR